MLTEIETKILELKKQGLTYKQIAKEMGTHEQTAYKNAQRAARKSGDEFMLRKNQTLTWRKDGGVRDILGDLPKKGR